jgi:GT2 family glycosyltransferase
MALVQHLPSLTPVPEPVCSVCIANYNGVHMLADCVDSVLAQNPGVPVEIIIHDDASTDDSVAFLREHYPQVEILASADNVGFCIGNNRMVAQARGEYVLLLNNDAALLSDAMASLLDAARNQAPAGILTLPQYDWQSGDLVDRGCLLDLFYNPVPNLDADRRDVAYGIGACMFLPRTLWNELGGFPAWLGSLAEDMYLCCLARLRGLPVQVAKGSGYRHRQGASFGGNRADAGGLHTTYRRRALSERNKTTVMMVCTPTLFTWPWLALHLGVLGVEGTLLSLLRHDKQIWRQIYWPALVHVLSELGALRTRRREVQRARRVSLGVYMKVFSPSWRKVSLLRRHGIPEVR